MPETADAAQAEESNADAPEAPAPEQQELDLGDAGKKAIADERKARKAAEKRASELDSAVLQLQSELQQYADRDKTEDQKRQEAFDAAKAAEAAALKDAEDARDELRKYRVGTEKGLSPTLIERLRGTTEEELAADADRLLEEFSDRSKPRKPQPDPTLGRGAAAGATTADQFAAAMNSLL